VIVKLFDKTEIVVSQDEAKKIGEAINKGVKMISIKGSLINPSSIASIMPGGHTQADVMPWSKRLPPPDHRGLASPAKEVLRKRLKGV